MIHERRVALAAGAGLLLLCARKYFANWGSTKDEARMRLPGDELIRQPALGATEGIYIARSAAEVWPWLVHIGEHRCRPQAPTVVDVIEERAIVLHVEPPALPWEATWSLHLLPRGNDRCRLLVRTRVGLRHPGEVILAEIARPAVSLVSRGVLRRIRRHAEGRDGPRTRPAVNVQAPMPDAS